MEALRDIKKRIRGVKEIQKITRAMKMVATSKFRKAEKRIETTCRHIDELFRIYMRVIAGEPMRRHSFYECRKPGACTGLLVITADKGLCGGFNGNLIRHAKSLIHQEEAAGKKVKLVLGGKKGRDHFVRLSQWEILMEEPGLFKSLSYAHAGRLTEQCIEAFLKKEVDRVWIVYTGYRAMGDFGPTYKELLPITSEGQEIPEDAKRNEYAFDPDWGRVLSLLLPAYVSLEVFNCLLQSEAAEHVARMNAMNNASNNAQDLIGELTLRMNKARQAMITAEILDIVGGAEALGG